MKISYSPWRYGVISGFTFFITAIILSIAYAATIGNIWTSPSILEASTWATLSASDWNKLLANFNNLDAKVNSLLSNSGGLWANQIWYNVTGSRAKTTWYQNTTWNPIMVYANHSNSHNWGTMDILVWSSTSNYMTFSSSMNTEVWKKSMKT